MSGSEAEVRIRTKAERLLRDLFPDARIIHEFDLGGVRLDLAAATDDRLVLVEIKSERDTLTRLERQVSGAKYVGCLVLVMVAERWVGKIPHLYGNAITMVEDGEGFTCFAGAQHRYPLQGHHLDPRHDRYNNRALMGLLLKPELLALARPFGGKTKQDVGNLQAIVHENLTGREIRRGVMAALRRRRFGWTCDAPVEMAA